MIGCLRALPLSEAALHSPKQASSLKHIWSLSLAAGKLCKKYQHDSPLFARGIWIWRVWYG